MYLLSHDINFGGVLTANSSFQTSLSSASDLISKWLFAARRFFINYNKEQGQRCVWGNPLLILKRVFTYLS